MYSLATESAFADTHAYKCVSLSYFDERGGVSEAVFPCR